MQDGRADFHGLFLDLAWVAAESGSKLHAFQTLSRGSMLTDFAKRLECSGLPALSDRSRIGTICKRSFMNASAKSPQSFRSQSGSKLHALHTLARGSMLTKILHVFIVAAW